MALDFTTTTVGRQAILDAIAGASVVTVQDVRLSNVDQTITEASTTITNVVATLTDVVGTVRVAGSGHALHVVIKDDSAAAYDVRAIGLRLTVGDTLIMACSQAGLIATKAAESSLHLALDLTIDADTAAAIDFGDTDFSLPAAGESAPGVVELATEAEAKAGADPLRAITPATLDALLQGFGGQIELSSLDRGRFLSRTIPTPSEGSGYLRHGAWIPEIGKFVISGIVGVGILTSVDGITWIQSDTQGCQRVVWAERAGLLVALGDDDLKTSDDGGATWDTQAGAGANPDGFAYDADQDIYLLVGNSGLIQWSSDLITWNTVTPAASYSGEFLDVEVSPAGKGVAVGRDLEVQITSDTDGTWTHIALGFGAGTNDIWGVAYRDGVWVVVGDLGIIGYSTDDGATWTQATSVATSSIRAVRATRYGFLASGVNGIVLWSADGVSWVQAPGWDAADDLSFIDVSEKGVLAVGQSELVWHSPIPMRPAA